MLCSKEVTDLNVKPQANLIHEQSPFFIASSWPMVFFLFFFFLSSLLPLTFFLRFSILNLEALILELYLANALPRQHLGDCCQCYYLGSQLSLYSQLFSREYSPIDKIETKYKQRDLAFSRHVFPRQWVSLLSSLGHSPFFFFYE